MLGARVVLRGATARARLAEAHRQLSSHLRVVAVNDVYELHNLPRLRSLCLELRKAHQGAFLTTLAGDFVSPSILSGLDKGPSMIESLNGVPITHCCFGNHEADIKLKELAPLAKAFKATWLNSNIAELSSELRLHPPLPEWDVVDVPTDRGPVKVGLLGLLTSERGVLRKDSFRGMQIGDVNEAAARLGGYLRTEHGCEAIVALTHQSVAADEALAAAGTVDLILGGHEHEVRLRCHTP